MQLHTYLNFNGQCEEAFRFYASTLGGEVQVLMTHADSPMAKDTAPEWLGKILHGRVLIAGQVVMGSDMPAGASEKPQGFHVTLNIDEPVEAERIFALLQDGAEVRMPLQETFWAQRFGMLTDRFGTPWMINCELPRDMRSCQSA